MFLDEFDHIIKEFQSTPSARRATNSGHRSRGCLWYFNPRSPWGERHGRAGGVLLLDLFQSTPSARRATLQKRGFKRRMVISIHALREESDTPTRIPASTHTYFNPRPPRGGRLASVCKSQGFSQFQSTPSARRATRGSEKRTIHCAISIHALREEGDQTDRDRISTRQLFQSTPSARRATKCGRLTDSVTVISIHALREEGDMGQRKGADPQREFQSTPSARRATGAPQRAAVRRTISIHALREEGDGALPSSAALVTYFNPRPPRGGRPMI